LLEVGWGSGSRLDPGFDLLPQVRLTGENLGAARATSSMLAQQGRDLGLVGNDQSVKL
jgi:hypothetical protein